MHCILLLPDAAGRVPTAKELRRRGFAVSEAVERPGARLTSGDALAGKGRYAKYAEAERQAPGLGQAAEEQACYGEPHAQKP